MQDDIKRAFNSPTGTGGDFGPSGLLRITDENV